MRLAESNHMVHHMLVHRDVRQKRIFMLLAKRGLQLKEFLLVKSVLMRWAY